MAKRRKKNRLPWIIVIAVGLIAGLIIVNKTVNKPKGTKVQTEQSKVRTVYSRVTESGNIQPTIDVPIAPDVSGEIVFIGVKEGQRVKKGDLLVTILPDDYKAMLEQSQASLAQTRASYLQAQAAMSQAEANLMQDSINMIRNQQLFKDNVISQIEKENSELAFNISKSNFNSAKFNKRAAFYRVKNAEAATKQARQNLDRTNIYASMDGTITELNIELGQRVVGTSQMAGTEILKIADLSSMEVIVEINENDIVNVSLGDSAKIEVDAFPDDVFFGHVTEIAYSANVAGLGSTDQVTNFEVKVKIAPVSYKGKVQEGKTTDVPQYDESPFRPGMTSLLEIYTRRVEDAVVVPIQAVTLRDKEKGGEEGQDSTFTVANRAKEKESIDDDREEVIFVVEGDSVKQVIVKTGISDDSFIEIKEGIRENAEVVTGPYGVLTKQLKQGEKVEVDNSRKKGKEWGKKDN